MRNVDWECPWCGAEYDNTYGDPIEDGTFIDCEAEGCGKPYEVGVEYDPIYTPTRIHKGQVMAEFLHYVGPKNTTEWEAEFGPGYMDYKYGRKPLPDELIEKLKSYYSGNEKIPAYQLKRLDEYPNVKEAP